MISNSLAILNLLLAVVVASVPVVSQSRATVPEKPSANSWMLTPTPYRQWNQDIQPSVRAQRDAAWDEAAMIKEPLTLSVRRGNINSCTGDYDMAWEPLDLSIHVPNRAVLTATFVKFRSVLSASQISLYTEIKLLVDEVFQDQTITAALRAQGHRSLDPGRNCNPAVRGNFIGCH